MTISIQASNLHHALRVAAGFAADPRVGIPTLSAVLLESCPRGLSAVATDRYTFGCETVKAAIDGTFRFLLPIAEVKHIAAVFPVSRKNDRDLLLSTKDGVLTVASGAALSGGAGAVLRIAEVPGDFPPYAGTFEKAGANRGTTQPFLVNPAYFARIDRAKRYQGEAMQVHSAPVNRPLIVTVGDHFIGMVMPLRSDDAANLDGWSWLLSPGPVAATEQVA